MNDFDDIIKLLETLLRQSLKEQGHNMTGSLSKSIDIQVKGIRTLLRRIEILGFVNDYGIPLDTGVPASRVPFSIPGRAPRSKYIAGLIRFVKLRRIATGKKAKSIAFAIAKTHKKQGIPSIRSRRFSKNGKRTGWITDTLDDNAEKIGNTLINILEKGADELFEQAIKAA